MASNHGNSSGEGSSNPLKGWYFRKTRPRHPFWRENFLFKGNVWLDSDGKAKFFPPNQTMSIKDQHKLMWLIRDEQQKVEDIEASVEDMKFWNIIRYKWAQKTGQWINNIDLKYQYENMYWLESKDYFFFWYPPELAEDPDEVANEISRCYKHRWTDEHDELLLKIHSEMMIGNKDNGGDFLSGYGWKLVHRKFVEITRHLVGLHNIQMRYHEVMRKKSGLEETSDPTVDLDCNLIPYREWKIAEDNFLRRWFDELILVRLPNHKKKKFLNGEDWQEMQRRFQFFFNCSITQSQLQSRMHKLNKDEKVEELRHYKEIVENDLLDFNL